MTAEEQIARLEEQLTQVLEQLRKKDEQLQVAQEQLRVAQARIEELEKQKTPAPSFVKANVKKPQESQKKARKKRDTKYNQARRRSTPTQIVEHRLVHCPEGHLRLGGITLARLREVIDVPSPPPVEFTQHPLYKGCCARSRQWQQRLDLDSESPQHSLLRVPSLAGRRSGQTADRQQVRRSAGQRFLCRLQHPSGLASTLLGALPTRHP